jgi:hypothetical protein
MIYLGGSTKMMRKKGIAFLMALLMMLSTMPAVKIFARSDNYINSGSVVISDKTLLRESGANAQGSNSKINNITDTRSLIIELDNSVSLKANDRIQINLENANFFFRNNDTELIAEPADKGDSAKNVYQEALSMVGDGATTTSTESYGGLSNSTYNTGDGVWFVSSANSKSGVYARYGNGSHSLSYLLQVHDDSWAELIMPSTYKPNDDQEDDFFEVPMVVRTIEDVNSGDVQVAIDSNSYGITGSTLTFATITSGTGGITVATIPSIKTGKNSIAIDKITIKEKVLGTINVGSDSGSQGFYLELPSGYEFANSNISVTASGLDLVGLTTSFDGSNNNRINVKLTNVARTSSGSGYGRIFIEGVTIIPTDDDDDATRQNEDIELNIGNIGYSMLTEQTLLVARYSDYGLTVETKESVTTLTNGYLEISGNNLATNDYNKSAKLTVSEDTIGSLIDGRNLELRMESDSVKIAAVKIDNVDNISGISGTHYLGETGKVKVKEDKVVLNSLQKSDPNQKSKFSATFYLSIESGYVGDVSVSLYGTSISADYEEPIVIAKSINPLITSISTTYITPGTTCNIPDIVLTEQMNSEGYSSLKAGTRVKIGFQNNNNYLAFVGTPQVTTSGGLKVDSVSKDGGTISFRIKSNSSKNSPSSMTISGLQVSSSNSTPKGTYAMVIAGNAIAGNSNSATRYITGISVPSFSTDGLGIAKLQYGGSISLKLNIGDNTAIVNGKEVEMQVAPFIDSQTGTTYMQVSDIAKVTGRTCSFFDNRVQQVEGIANNLFVTIGDRTFQKDRSVVQIDGKSAPETMTNEDGVAVNMLIVNDYTCIPLRYFITKVLEQNITWNGVDNTITVN